MHLLDAEAERLRGEGNAAFKAKKFEEALDLYTKALRHAAPGPAAAIVFSNRAATLQKLSLISEAEQDCALAISCDKVNTRRRPIIASSHHMSLVMIVAPRLVQNPACSLTSHRLSLPELADSALKRSWIKLAV